MRRKNLGLLGMATDDSTASPPIAQDPGHSRSPPQLPIPVHNQSGLEGVSLSRLMPHSSLESQWAPQNGPQQTTPHLARAVPSRPHTGAPSGCAVPQPTDLHLKARPEAAEPLTQILEASAFCPDKKGQVSRQELQGTQQAGQAGEEAREQENLEPREVTAEPRRGRKLRAPLCAATPARPRRATTTVSMCRTAPAPRRTAGPSASVLLTS